MNKVVYRHRRLDTNEIFYVGIGKTEKRAYSIYNRNKHWHNIVNKVGYSVEIVCTCDTWSEACDVEKYLIKYYGRKDLRTGHLVNMTDGGDGTINRVASEETRAKISEAKSGKTFSEEHKVKLSKAHTGKKHTEEHRVKLSDAQRGEKNHRAKKVICTKTGKIWNTVSSCAIDNELNKSTLSKYLDGRLKNKTTFRYI